MNPINNQVLDQVFTQIRDTDIITIREHMQAYDNPDFTQVMHQVRSQTRNKIYDKIISDNHENN